MLQEKFQNTIDQNDLENENSRNKLKELQEKINIQEEEIEELKKQYDFVMNGRIIN